MVRATSTFIIMTIGLAVFLNISGLAIATDKKCKKSGEFCGGIAGFECCKELECILEGDFPDAGGECKPPECRKVGEFCGGIAAFQCCKGLECVLDGDFPDAGGKCKQSHYKPTY
ncbi:Trypsin inhibitor 2 [Bienertia sinuspersici]